ncbi:hypothetical protein EV175_007572, partial [Coemansia sp. RSA 1933]
MLFGKHTAAVQVVGKNIFGQSSQAAPAAVYEALGLDVPEEFAAVQEESAPLGAASGEKDASAAVLEPTATSDTVVGIAQRLAFPEAFGTQTVPRAGEHTFAVKVSALRRMTPAAYDRNIIHIE